MGHQTFFHKYSNNQILYNIVPRKKLEEEIPLPLQRPPVQTIA